MKGKVSILSILALIASSCGQSNVEYIEKFPLSEDELINANFGILLEYAIFDSTKIDVVKNIICDSISNNLNLSFKKIETIINDSSYFFFHCKEREIYRSDYIGNLFFDINNLDSMSMYNYSSKYGISDIDKIIDKVVEYNKTSISAEKNIDTVDGVVKHWKMGNIYIPYLICFVEFDSFNCEDGFVEKVIFVNKTINRLMDAYSEKKFPNEKIIIRPQIEIRFDFNLLYPPLYPHEVDFDLNVLLDLVE